MPKTLSQIIDTEARARPHISAEWDVSTLQRASEVAGSAALGLSDFVPIRLATCIEKAIRASIREAVDHGEPYRSRGFAVASKQTPKIIMEAVAAVADGSVTIGQIVAHGVSTSRVSEIIGSLQALFGDQLRDDLARATTRWIEPEHHQPKPIIADINGLMRGIERILEVRHIVVHEAPLHSPYSHAEIPSFFAHTQQFVTALGWLVVERLFDRVPYTQREMNAAAGNALQAALDDLAKARREKYPKPTPARQAIEKAWDEFAETAAKDQAGYNDAGQPGTIAPLLWAKEMEELTRWRTEHIRSRKALSDPA